MEFKAIIDAKARNDAGCAVVGVYEEGDLGIAAGRIDKQLGGLIGKLRGNGDFSGKLGDVMLLPTPAGTVAARLPLSRLWTRPALGRQHDRQALPSAGQTLAKTGG